MTTIRALVLAIALGAVANAGSVDKPSYTYQYTFGSGSTQTDHDHRCAGGKTLRLWTEVSSIGFNTTWDKLGSDGSGVATLLLGSGSYHEAHPTPPYFDFSVKNGDVHVLIKLDPFDCADAHCTGGRLYATYNVIKYNAGSGGHETCYERWYGIVEPIKQH